MAWLRIDDGFAAHPKIAQLTDREFRIWMRALCYCARYETEGNLPKIATEEVPGFTPNLIAKCIRIGLIDQDENGTRSVHDWKLYNAKTIAEKVAAYLSKHPEASANEVQRAVGGKRELVLAEIERQRPHAGSQSVPGPVPEVVPNRYPSRAGAGEPVPSPTPEDPPAAAGPRKKPPGATSAAADPDLEQRLHELDFGGDETAAALAEPVRAWAWIHHAETHASESVGGYAWTNFQRGGWPAEQPDHDKPRLPLMDIARSTVTAYAAQYPDEALLDEIDKIERKRDEHLTDEQRAELLELAHERRQQTAAA